MPTKLTRYTAISTPYKDRCRLCREKSEKISIYSLTIDIHRDTINAVRSAIHATVRIIFVLMEERQLQAARNDYAVILFRSLLIPKGSWFYECLSIALVQLRHMGNGLRVFCVLVIL